MSGENGIGLEIIWGLIALMCLLSGALIGRNPRHSKQETRLYFAGVVFCVVALVAAVW